MKIGLPAGIGDFSWAWSKLYHIRDQITGIQIADGWPHRTTPYVELCLTREERARIEVKYGDFNYQTIRMNVIVNQMENPTLDQILARKDEGCILLEPNNHLEMGKRLEEWIPNLPCNFHYPLYTEAMDYNNMAKKLFAAFDAAGRSPHDTKYVGVSCASYRGSEAWKTWGVNEWEYILTKMLDTGYTPILIGGFWDDLTYTLACKLKLPELVGKTSQAECIELLRVLPAYIGFSSGLNVIRTVLNKPAFALWPDFQEELSRSWAPPHMLDSNRYVRSLWRDPTEVWPVMEQFLQRCREEVKRNAEEVHREVDGPRGNGSAGSGQEEVHAAQVQRHDEEGGEVARAQEEEEKGQEA